MAHLCSMQLGPHVFELLRCCSIGQCGVRGGRSELGLTLGQLTRRALRRRRLSGEQLLGCLQGGLHGGLRQQLRGREDIPGVTAPWE